MALERCEVICGSSLICWKDTGWNEILPGNFMTLINGDLWYRKQTCKVDSYKYLGNIILEDCVTTNIWKTG